MHKRELCDGIEVIANVDWNRRLFDSLIPLPDGTSYNSYIVHGSEKTAVIDTADPRLSDGFLTELDSLDTVDFVVSNHSEQDHSGLIPAVLEKFPTATLLCSEKAEDLLITHLGVEPGRVRAVKDGEKISLGDKTLEFIYTPWVHWPETMSTYVPEDKVLFSCDFFGSHLATTDLFVRDKARVYEAAKRYYAEIMMPFRRIVTRNLKRLDEYEIGTIAPSHGPAYDEPAFIVDAYRDWVSETAKNEVVLPYVSMHGSTKMMVDYLIDRLAARGVTVYPFELSVADIGQLAIRLVDAATLVVATPTFHVGSHPAVYYAAHLANLLKPKLKYAAMISSYGWNSKAFEQLTDLIPHLKVEVLGTILQKGEPVGETYEELDALAAQIADAHEKDETVHG